MRNPPFKGTQLRVEYPIKSQSQESYSENKLNAKKTYY